jgi:hypothetical protein
MPFSRWSTLTTASTKFAVRQTNGLFLVQNSLELWTELLGQLTPISIVPARLLPVCATIRGGEPVHVDRSIFSHAHKPDF